MPPICMRRVRRVVGSVAYCLLAVAGGHSRGAPPEARGLPTYARLGEGTVRERAAVAGVRVAEAPPSGARRVILPVSAEIGVDDELATESPTVSETSVEDGEGLVIDRAPLRTGVPRSLAGEELGTTNRGTVPRADTYFDAEYLLWGLDGVAVPRILTSNPAGTPLANVSSINDPSTQTLIGGEDVGGLAQSGMRIRLGHVPGNEWLSRWELSGWFLFQQGNSWSVNSVNGDPIIARPFFNTATGLPDAQLVGFPGIASGIFNAEYNQRLFGVDPLIFTCLTGDSCRSLEGVTGYQYLRIEDEFRTNEQVTATPGGLIAPGTMFLVQDEFRSTNDYHLFPLGVNYVRRTDYWRVGFRALMGLGFVNQSVRIRGETTVSADGSVVSTTPGGFLALGSNSGTHERTEFAWSPQLNFNLRRNLRSGLWLQAGYTMIYMSDVARSLRFIDPNIDPNQLPPPTGAGTSPAFDFITSGELIHGLNAGLQWNF